MKNKLQLLKSPREIPPSILVNETKEKFGYDPRFLKNNSFKPVLKKLECCGLIVERKFRDSLLFKSCLNCSNKNVKVLPAEFLSARTKEWFRTHKHPRKDVILSEETKDKIRKANLGKITSEETKDKIRKANIGKPCPQKALDYWKNPNHLGINHHSYGKKTPHSRRIWFLKKDGNKVCFRSVWEARVAKYLDNNNIDWQYETRVIPVSYMWENKIKQATYRSDFFLPIENKFIEVKGFWRYENIFKFFALVSQYKNISIEVWDKEILKALGIRTDSMKNGEFDENI